MTGRGYWSIVVLVLVGAAIALYLNSQRQLLAAFQNVSLSAVIYLIALRLLFLVTNGLFLREFASKFGVRLVLKEWFGLSAVTTMGNYITPFSGGLIARAAYLKYRYAFPYAQFATVLASSYLVMFWVVGVVGVLTLVTFAGTAPLFWQMVPLFAAVVMAISALVVLPPVELPWNNRLTRIINTSLEGWALVKNDRLLLTRLVVYTLINVLLNGLSFWMAYKLLGSPISFATALLVSLLAVFSILINVTPGNLGIQEAVISLSSGLLGAGAGQGLLAALLIRAATLALAFTLGPVFSVLLTRELTAHQLASMPSAPDTEQASEEFAGTPRAKR
jgi:uncharacterized membrane protein YbhN (UPF0104 family)